MMIKLFFIALSFALAAPTYAQIFRLNANVNSGNAALDAAIAAEIQNAEDEINEGLPGAPPKRLMEGMANASVLAGKGLGSDYASGMDVFLIGAGVGAAADLEKDKTTNSDLSGVSAHGGLLIGTNLAWMDSEKILGLDTNRLKFYVNYFDYNLNRTSGDTSIEADLFAVGTHVSYQWILGSSSKLLGWGGVQFHLGYEYQRSNLTFSSNLNETVEATSGSEGATTTVTGNPKATVKAATQSIPFEISTSVQILYLFSLYGGLGADYNIGSATGKGDINSGSSDITCTTAGCGGAGTVIGTVSPTAALDAKGKVNPFLYRGFAGLQINLPYIRIFVQADKAFGNELIGASAGVRLVF